MGGVFTRMGSAAAYYLNALKHSLHEIAVGRFNQSIRQQVVEGVGIEKAVDISQ